MRKRLWKITAIVLLVGAIVTGGYALLARMSTGSSTPTVQNATPRAEPSTGLKGRTLESSPTHPAAMVAPAKVVESPGKVIFPDKVRLHFEVAGRVESVLVDEAVSVRKGEPMASLDTVALAGLQKQVAAARVALDNAEKALKDEKETYPPGEVLARQAQVAQLQKNQYVLQRAIDDAQELYRDKAKDLLGVSVPLTLLNQPPEQLIAALLAQMGVQPFWGAFHDHVRPKLETPWEKINNLQDQSLQLQQTLRGLRQQQSDLADGHSGAKAQSDVKIKQGKLELAQKQRDSALLQKDSALVLRDTARIAYRDKIRDILGLTLAREQGNGFYIHLQKGPDWPMQVQGEELAKHVRVLLGVSLDSQELSGLPPDKIVARLWASREGQDHILDFFLRQRLQGAWLTLGQTRQTVEQYNLNRNQASTQYLGFFGRGATTGTATLEGRVRDLQVAEIQLQTAIQARDQSLVVYKQLFRDYLNVDLDSQPQLVAEEKSPDSLIIALRSLVQLTSRLQQELTDALRTPWSLLQLAENAVLSADTAIQEADMAIQEAKEALRQVQNTLDDLTSKTTQRRLEAQEQTVLVQFQQAQDKLKNAREDYQKVLDDYLNISPKEKLPEKLPIVLLHEISPENTTGFRRFIKDVSIEAQGPWGQFQQAREQLGNTEVSLKKSKEDLDDALKGPDPLLVALREQEVALTRKQHEDAKQKLDGATMKAPFDGIISQVMVDPGDSVESDQTVLEILNPNTIEIEAILDELDVAQLAPGMIVQIKLDAFPNQVLPGKLVSVEPLPQTAGLAIQYKAKVQFAAKPSLLLYEGMSARLNFQAPGSSSGTR